MGTIIRNTSTPYRIGRQNGFIIRTPIRLKLAPDEKKLLQIGDPATRDASGYLHGGFRGNGTSQDIVAAVGYQFANEAVNGTPLWVDSSGSHDPEFVWYQGAYSTSYNGIQTGKTLSEAYAQFPGFHFTIPPSRVPTGMQIRQIDVKYVNMGACWAYGPAIDHNSRNKNIKNADYGWDASSPVAPVYMKVMNTPTCNYHPRIINQNTYPYDIIDLDVQVGAGGYRGDRDLWTLGGNNVDGRIPTLTNPVVQQYTMGTNTFNMFSSNRGGWIIPFFFPEINSTTDYTPASGWGGTGTNNYWACMSLRDVSIELVIE